MVWSGGEDLGEEDAVKRSDWKPIDEDDGSTQRMTVPGGHLYRTVITRGESVAVAMVFVPTLKSKPRPSRQADQPRTRRVPRNPG